MSIPAILDKLLAELDPKNIKSALSDFYHYPSYEKKLIESSSLGAQAFLQSIAKLDNIQSMFEFRDELQIGVALGWTQLKGLSDLLVSFIRDHKIKKKSNDKESAALTEAQLNYCVKSIDKQKFDTLTSFLREKTLRETAKKARDGVEIDPNLVNNNNNNNNNTVVVPKNKNKITYPPDQIPQQQKLVATFREKFRDQIDHQSLIALIEFLNQHLYLTPQEKGRAKDDRTADTLSGILDEQTYISSLSNIKNRFLPLMQKYKSDPSRFSSLTSLCEWVENWVDENEQAISHYTTKKAIQTPAEETDEQPTEQSGKNEVSRSRDSSMMEAEIDVEEWKHKFLKAGSVEKLQLVKQLLAVRSKFLECLKSLTKEKSASLLDMLRSDDFGLIPNSNENSFTRVGALEFSGSFGVVHKGKMNGKDVSKKRVTFRDGNNNDKRMFRLELAIGWIFDHPNLLHCIAGGISETHGWYVAEWMEFSLRTFLQKNHDKMEKKYAQNLVFQFWRGLNELHIHKVVHRDLKPENILVSNDGSVLKICDYGLAIIENNTTAVRGTVEYRAPELDDQEDNKAAHPSVDIYAFGLIVFEIWKAPNSGESLPNRRAKVLLEFAKKEIWEPIPTDTLSSAEWKKVVDSCVQRDANKRPNCTELESRIPGLQDWLSKKEKEEK